MTRTPIWYKKRSQIFECSLFTNTEQAKIYQSHTKNKFNRKIKVLPKLIESHLVRQAFKLQIYRYGMRWRNEDFNHYINSQHSWACFITSPANNFFHQLQGFLLLRVIGDDAEILSLGVKDTIRRNGIGKYLLKQAKNFSGRNQLKSIFLEVAETNRNAVGFYQKQGFQTIGNRRNYYVFSEKNKKNALVMCLPIKNE